jgi:hypothetical protein
MKILLFSLFVGLLLVACEKQETLALKVSDCVPCQDYTFEDPTATLGDGVYQKVVVDLKKSADGQYYQAGQVDYYQDKHKIASVSYEFKDGRYVGTKYLITTKETADVAAGEQGERVCLPSPSSVSSKCCAFEQKAIL